LSQDDRRVKKDFEEILMSRPNARKTETPDPELSIDSALPEREAQPLEQTEAVSQSEEESGEEPHDIENILNSLKTLLSTVEKLQKVRQDVGDVKPLLVRMLDGELMSGEELEQLKTGVSGLLRLVRAHTDHQAALEKAQPARALLDEVLRG
jgi:hypothetical protein